MGPRLVDVNYLPECFAGAVEINDPLISMERRQVTVLRLLFQFSFVAWNICVGLFISEMLSLICVGFLSVIYSVSQKVFISCYGKTFGSVFKKKSPAQDKTLEGLTQIELKLNTNAWKAVWKTIPALRSNVLAVAMVWYTVYFACINSNQLCYSALLFMHTKIHPSLWNYCHMATKVTHSRARKDFF